MIDYDKESDQNPGKLSKSMAVYHKGRFYLLGGYDIDSQYVNDVYAIDPTDAGWVKLTDASPFDSYDTGNYSLGEDPSLPGDPYITKISKPVSFGLGEYIYVLGKTKADNDFIMYRMDENGVFEEVRDVGLPDYRDEFSYTVSNDKFYLYGGVTRSGETYLNDFYVFDGEEFTSLDDGPSPRANARLLNYNDNLYLFGGYNFDYKDIERNERYSADMFLYDGAEWKELSKTSDPVKDQIFKRPPDPVEHQPYTENVVYNTPIIASVRKTGKKIRCSWKDKDRIKINGDAYIYFEFKYGEPFGLNINPLPVISYTSDNTLTFQAEVVPGGNQKLIAGYAQVEGVRDTSGQPFTSFGYDFFQNYLRISPLQLVYTNNSSPVPEIQYNKGNYEELDVFSLDGKQQSSFNTAGAKRVSYNKTLPPGEYYIHFIVLSQDFDDFWRVFKYELINPVYGRACGKNVDVRPESQGVSGPGGRPTYYYTQYVFRVRVPEITNFSDVLEVSSKKDDLTQDPNFLRPGFMKMYWAMPPDLVNSMRPIIYGAKSEPNSMIIPIMGRSDIFRTSVENFFVTLMNFSFTTNSAIKDNYFDLFRGIINAQNLFMLIQSDDYGNFEYQPMNILPYNRVGDIPYYFLKVLSVTKNTKNKYGYDIVGAPPVKIAITKENLKPRIFNYSDGDISVTPRPVIKGAFNPNTLFSVKVNDGEDFYVRAGYDGNFRFTLPSDLNKGENVLSLASINDPAISRSIKIIYDNQYNEEFPRLVNYQNGAGIFTASPTFQVTYKPDTLMEYILDNKKIGEFIINSKGHGLVYLENLSEGQHVLSVYP